MLVVYCCLGLILQQVAAVVNSGSNTVSSEDASIATNNNDNNEKSTSQIEDSVAVSTNEQANERGAIVGLTDSFVTLSALDGVYGPPIDTYLPHVPSNLGLPQPVYGVPDGLNNIGTNFVYPPPPPDIPPPLPILPNGINDIKPPHVKNGLTLPSLSYGPPKFYGPLKFNHQIIQGIPKPIGPPHFQRIKPLYGVPKPQFQKQIKPFYGPPKSKYGPPKLIYGPPKYVHIPINTIQVPPVDVSILNPPPLKNIFGPPINLEISNDITKLLPQYGPPEPIPHGPPPGVPAPPTPPDIKYDGWQPILGLVANSPSDAYNVAHKEQHYDADIQIENDLTPPPAGGVGVGIHSLSLQDSYRGSEVVKDSYGAPLNIVTGTGGIISSSGEAHIRQHQQSHNVNQHHQHQEHHQQHHQEQHQQNHLHDYSHGQHQQQVDLNAELSALGLQGDALSVVKSVGFQIYPQNNIGSIHDEHRDSYSAPPLNSYDVNGPYAAAHSYHGNGVHSSLGGSALFSFESNNRGKHVASNGIGLIPPNGLYGVAPSSQYGTPLFQPTRHNFNDFKISQPHHPVIFREPVPQGFIESIGHSVQQNDNLGIIKISHDHAGQSVYIPPPVPDVTKSIEQHSLTNLYTLPDINGPVSFQNVVHGSSTSGLVNNFDSFNQNNLHSATYNFDSAAHESSIGDEVPKVGNVNAVYALPLQGNNANIHQFQKSNFDANQAYSYNNFGAFGHNYNIPSGSYGPSNLHNIKHDCSLHSSQPLPDLTDGSHNKYIESLSSLKTNIGGYTSDLHTSNSNVNIKTASGSSSNSITNTDYKEDYGKSLGQSLVKGGELIESQNIDLNNIPLEGNLGSYTLQIQPVNGLGQTGSSSQVPHAQVLNDGLLQSILAAIEQPQNGVNFAGHSILQVQPSLAQYHSQIGSSPIGEPRHNVHLENRSDYEAQESQKNSVTVLAPSIDQKIEEKNVKGNFTEEIQGKIGEGSQSTQNNEIISTREILNNKVKKKELHIEPQYESYVSFKNTDASYSYGNNKSEDVKIAKTKN